MDIIKLYYYTSIPLVACNLLFYTITSLSNSITSSQNVSRFIYEHKDCDSIIFNKELDKLDIKNKLHLIELLLLDIIKKYSKNEKEYYEIIEYIKQPIKYEIIDSNELDFICIKNNSINFDNYQLFKNIDEPIKYSIISVYEIIEKINEVIIISNNKIKDYNNHYLKQFITFSLKNEIAELKYYSEKLEKRFIDLNNMISIYKFTVNFT